MNFDLCFDELTFVVSFILKKKIHHILWSCNKIEMIYEIAH